jgi:sulfide dehydrogenase cytochrome subunit
MGMKLVIVAAFLVFSLVFADASRGAELAELTANCESCHGVQGVSSHDDVPTIAGQAPEFIARTLQTYQRWDRPCIKTSYRSGDTSRPKTDMCQVAESLTDDDMQALGMHYGSLPFVPAAQDFDAELAAGGAALHAEHCEKCHENGGKEAGREPRLAGQWVPYLRTSIKYVPTGEHLVPRLMEMAVAEFSKEELDQLMNFYASQQE